MRWLLFISVSLLAARAAFADTAPRPADEAGVQFFETKIRPLLVDRCYHCHSAGAKKLKGDLRLDTHADLLKGGGSGPAISPGHPDKSRLIEAIGYSNPELQMPPKGKLTDQQIADLTRWVAMGAPWPAERIAPATPTKPGFDLAARKAAHWAWQPLKVQEPPRVQNAAWATSGIDRFILATLEEKGLEPAPPANRRSLIRRASFDLIGLPPTPAEVEAFLADASPDAFARVVDRLLASPHYGERWGRHWLDLVRYAETYGHEFDYPIANAYQYRDYVIRAFNADGPYNQFVSEQIAGDLLPRPRTHPTEGFNESIIGTGFWFFGEQIHSPVDVRQHQADRVDNQIDVLGKTFLALTLGCARCHDHKFDAISQKDVYSLWGFAESTHRQDALLDPHGHIAEARAKMQATCEHADKILADALPKAGADLRDSITRYLLAVRYVHIGRSQPADAAATNQTINAIARDRSLDPKRLSAWVAALEERITNQPTHPLYAWTTLGNEPADSFIAHHDDVRSHLADECRKADASASRTELFKDFSDGTYAGWFTSGWAFGDAPLCPGRWDPLARGVRGTDASLARSGIPSPRLKGVLRSPTFTLTRDHVLYHVTTHGPVQIRLIIDGYTMDEFNGLLFAGAAFTIDTKGEWIWHRQAQDVSRYKGHRAHIEITADGNGDVALDQIRFADADAPLPLTPPDRTNAALLEDEHVTSPELLAEAYGSLIDNSVEHWKSGKIDAAGARLVNWALAHQLLDVSDAAEASLQECGKQINALAATLPEPMHVTAAADGTGIDENVYLRGNHKTPGDVAPRRFLEAIAGPDQPPVGSNCGRLELARRLTDPTNPLPARVMANRIWHHLMGRGIVASVDNFGVLGERPTHPELLDYLADRFMREGGSVKKLIREVILSRTYQMSARGSVHDDELDPDNRLLHRANLRRLDAEAIRDEILFVSGGLDDTLYGPSVNVYLTPFMEGRGRPASGPLDGAGRRSLYLAVRRNFLSPMLLAFDMPTPIGTIGRRTVSNVPAQALTLLNDPFIAAQARSWARHALADASAAPAQRLTGMYLEAFSRPPTEAEIANVIRYLDRQGEELGIAPERRAQDDRVWTEVAHALINAKEFIFLE